MTDTTLIRRPEVKAFSGLANYLDGIGCADCIYTMENMPYTQRKSYAFIKETRSILPFEQRTVLRFLYLGDRVEENQIKNTECHSGQTTHLGFSRRPHHRRPRQGRRHGRDPRRRGDPVPQPGCAGGVAGRSFSHGWTRTRSTARHERASPPSVSIGIPRRPFRRT